MSRVWKEFLKNLAWPVGFAAYLFAVTVGADYANTLVKGGALIVVVLFICIPVTVFLIRDMWRDAKRKVDWENEETMRALKGE
jgi:hypothetical protein